jgi:hypothetical protein
VQTALDEIGAEAGRNRLTGQIRRRVLRLQRAVQDTLERWPET